MLLNIKNRSFYFKSGSVGIISIGKIGRIRTTDRKASLRNSCTPVLHLLVRDQSPLSANIIAAIGHGLAQLVAFDVDADDANNVDVDGGVDIFG